MDKSTQNLLLTLLGIGVIIWALWYFTRPKTDGSTGTGRSGTDSNTLECRMRDARGNEITITCQKGDEACEKLCTLRQQEQQPYYIYNYAYWPYYYSWYPSWRRRWWNFGGPGGPGSGTGGGGVGGPGSGTGGGGVGGPGSGTGTT